MANRGANEHDRLTYLHNFVDQLSFRERAVVSRLVSEKNNPFAVLPIELVIEILSHLPLLFTWTLQSVCQQWRAVLNEKVVLQSLLRWETHDPSDSARIPMARESIANRTKRLRGIRTLTPVSSIATYEHALMEWPSFYAASLIRTFALKGRRLAFLSQDDTNAVVVRDLGSGVEQRLRGNAREGIDSICLTSTLLAFRNTSDKLYVKDLSNSEQEQKCIRLPSDNVYSLNGDGPVFALIMDSSRDSLGLVIYDNLTGKTTFNDVPTGIPSPNPGHSLNLYIPRAMLVNAEGKFVDIFQHAVDLTLLQATMDGTAVDNTPRSITIVHRRVSFTGEFDSSSVATIPRKGEGIDFGDLLPTGIKGEYAFQTQTQNPGAYEAMPAIFVFQSEEARLTTRSLSFGFMHHLRMDPRKHVRLAPVLWKGLEIFPDHAGRILCSSGDSTRALFLRGAAEASENAGALISIAVNDSFLVVLENLDGLMERSVWRMNMHVFCFDPELEWIGSTGRSA